MGGKRDRTVEGQDWYPSAVGDVFILVMLNGARLLQRVDHFEDAAHWGSHELPFADAVRIADPDGLPRWRMRRVASHG